MRELIKRLLFLLEKLRFLKKPAAFVPLILFVIILLFAGIFAITQETERELGADDPVTEDIALDFPNDEYAAEDAALSEWLPPGPPRWFRSNAGGMTLEETPSRLAALRSEYALVIDYAAPYEADARLLPYYHDDYSIEIRVLYKQREESRRQWLFRDQAGVTRVNAVFKPASATSDDESIDELSARLLSGNDDAEPFAEPDGEPLPGGDITDISEELNDDAFDELIEELAEMSEEAVELDEEIELAELGEDDMEFDEPPVVTSDKAEVLMTGFIEIYDENSRIIEDRWLYEDEGEIVISYIYNGSALIKAETLEKIRDLSSNDYPALSAGELAHGYFKMYTDNYRYNRSYSLRYVERQYHQPFQDEPVRLTFPSRVLEAAGNFNFFSDTLYLASDFFGNHIIGAGYRMVYDTDGRGRILIQTLFDDKGEVVWIIKNSWSGDRIITALKLEGEDEKLTEYEYDGAGKRIVTRDIHNGVLERLMYADGEKEIEELYLDGVLALRAYWEDGRKLSEERVRRQ